MKNEPETHWVRRKPAATESGIHRYTDRINDCKPNFSDGCRSARKLVSWLWSEIHRTREVHQTLLQCWFLEEHEKREFFITLEDHAFDHLKGSCREYTLPRGDESSHVRGWIHGNTKIGPVLDMKVCRHQGRYDVEIMIESLFLDWTVSLVRILNGINTYVSETSEDILVASVGDRSAKELGAKARPRPTPTCNVVSYVHFLSRPKMNRYRAKEVQPRLFRSMKVSDQITATWRFSSSRRRWSSKTWRSGRIVKVKVCGHLIKWPVQGWINFLARRRRTKRKRFSIAWTLVHPNISCISEQYKTSRIPWPYIARQCTINGWRRRAHLPPSGPLTTCTPSSSVDWFQEVILKRDKQSEFFTAVNPMRQNLEVQYNVDKPRIAGVQEHLKNSSKIVYWCNLKLAQREGLQLYQTRSNAIALFITLPAICIEKVVYMKIGEEFYCKVYLSAKLPRAVLTPNLHHGRKDLSNSRRENIRRPSTRTKREVRGNSSR